MENVNSLHDDTLAITTKIHGFNVIWILGILLESLLSLEKIKDLKKVGFRLTRSFGRTTYSLGRTTFLWCFKKGGMEILKNRCIGQHYNNIRRDHCF